MYTYEYMCVYVCIWSLEFYKTISIENGIINNLLHAITLLKTKFNTNTIKPNVYLYILFDIYQC